MLNVDAVLLLCAGTLGLHHRCYFLIYLHLSKFGEKHLKSQPQTSSMIGWGIRQFQSCTLSLTLLPLGRNKQGSSPVPGTWLLPALGLPSLSSQSPLVAKSIPSPSCWGRCLKRHQQFGLFILPVEQLVLKASPFNTTLLFRLYSKLSSFLVMEGLFFSFPLQMVFLSLFLSREGKKKKGTFQRK